MQEHLPAACRSGVVEVSILNSALKTVESAGPIGFTKRSAVSAVCFRPRQ